MKPRNILVMVAPWSLPRLHGIARFTKERRWNIMMADRLEKYEDPGSFDGVLMTLRDRPDMVRTARRILERGVPAVDLTCECPSLPFARVASDNRQIGAVAARHFLEKGFSSFAWFSSAWSNVHALRLAGFADALPRGSKVARWRPGRLAEALKSAVPPIAVLAYNDADAARLVNACREAGLDVPTDIAVLGVGNDPFLCENQSTTISSVGQNLEEGAFRGAALLDAMIDMPAEERERLGAAPPELMPPGDIVSRDSSDTLAHTDPVVRAALVCIHKNISRPLGALEVARLLGLPRRSLDRIFAQSLHRSVGAEILRQRIIRAKRLLADHGMPVKQIARVCGFCNAAYLTNVFREETGLSPRQWRKSLAGK